MSDRGSSTLLKVGPWSAAEKEVLRSTIAIGGTVRSVAIALGRSKSSVEAAASDLDLRSMQRVPGPTRERIRGLVAEGWAASRISRRLRVSVDVVVFYSEGMAT